MRNRNKECENKPNQYRKSDHQTEQEGIYGGCLLHAGMGYGEAGRILPSQNTQKKQNKKTKITKKKNEKRRKLQRRNANILIAEGALKINDQ